MLRTVKKNNPQINLTFFFKSDNPTRKNKLLGVGIPSMYSEYLLMVLLTVLLMVKTLGKNWYWIGIELVLNWYWIGIELELINLMWNWNWPNGIDWNRNWQNGIDPISDENVRSINPMQIYLVIARFLFFPNLVIVSIIETELWLPRYAFILTNSKLLKVEEAVIL